MCCCSVFEAEIRTCLNISLKIFSFFRLIRDFFFLESVTSDALWGDLF